jgi:Holliday junction resolvase RusA-like endonuclease
MRGVDIKAIEKLARANGGKILRVNPPPEPRYAGANLGSGPWVIVANDWLPPLLNQLMRKRRRTAMRSAKQCKDDLGALLLKQPVPEATGTRRVRLEVTFPKGRIRPDPDAFAKALLDGLKHWKLIVDDSYEHVEYAPPVYWLGDRLRTEIHLEDIEPKVVRRKS